MNLLLNRKIKNFVIALKTRNKETYEKSIISYATPLHGSGFAGTENV